eukprot:UN25233
MELYAPPFIAAIKAGVGSVMCSYNKITVLNSKNPETNWACENYQTLTTELRGTFNYTGWVMSDWYATHSTILAANNGLDQQMPGGSKFGNALKQAVTNGDVKQEILDAKVYRILYTMYERGVFDTVNNGSARANVTSE